MMYDGNGNCEIEHIMGMREAQDIGDDGAMGLVLAGDLD
jgi:hypothetical protein